jgi:hypothetical protein
MTHFKLKLSVETLDIYVKERSITKLEDRRKSKVCKRHDDKIFKNATASNDSRGKQPPSELVSRFSIGPQDMA